MSGGGGVPSLTVSRDVLWCPHPHPPAGLPALPDSRFQGQRLLGDQGAGLHLVPLRPKLLCPEGSGPAFCGWEPEAIGQAAQPESALPPAPPQPRRRPTRTWRRDPHHSRIGTSGSSRGVPSSAFSGGRDASSAQITLPGASPRREPPPRPFSPASGGGEKRGQRTKSQTQGG